MAVGLFSNKFCRSDALVNEASVEQFFVARLLHDLGYKDEEIKPKTAISSLRVGKGRKKEPYKPDYLLYGRKRPRWIVDAKAVGENPDHFVDQGAGYCLAVNQKYEDNPVRYFMLTNGLLTRIYQWDREQPIMSLRFADFVDGNPKYGALSALLGADAARCGWTDRLAAPAVTHAMSRPDMAEVKKTFTRCHQIIWKAEKVSPQAAFLRFAKILFVKLWEDRKIRDNPEHLARIGRGEPLPADGVRFSTRWIEQQAGDEVNPVDHILFRQLVESLEAEIEARRRKRIFEVDARLEVSPGTVKRVVAQLEHQYLFGIDEDLNGRMFEGFLAATMRGKELGQYFTPRSIVKLMTRLGKPIASTAKIERVLDGCCGTGGFLIEALTEMRRQVYENTSLTKVKRAELLNEVANEAIFGIDAGQDPPLVKIARINMYLHGDGGSRVYISDGLRKTPVPSGAADSEGRHEVAELRGALEGDANAGPLHFDLVLTNPPFSMGYSKEDAEEWAVLKDYELRSWGGKSRPSLRSAVMFIERYWGLLRPGGRLLTVIDDSVLGGKKMAFVRDFIRERFTINAIISLHGDAFQRAGARVKTSLLCLTKKLNASEEQPSVFVHDSRYIGLDDVPVRTPQSVAEEARNAAQLEIEEIVTAYEKYRLGASGPWLVAPEKLGDRLDAKNLIPWSVEKLTGTWMAAGAETDVLENLVDLIECQATIKGGDRYVFLRITYEGFAEPGERRLGREISYKWVGSARANDVVVSNISAVYRAICVLPKEMEYTLVTPEFTILRIKPGKRRTVDPMYLWSVLRSPAVIAEWLSHSTGVGRHRVDWELLKRQRIPLLPWSRQEAIGSLHRQAYAFTRKSQRIAGDAIAAMDALDLYGEVAKDKMARAKPPR